MTVHVNLSKDGDSYMNSHAASVHVTLSIFGETSASLHKVVEYAIALLQVGIVLKLKQLQNYVCHLYNGRDVG